MSNESFKVFTAFMGCTNLKKKRNKKKLTLALFIILIATISAMCNTITKLGGVNTFTINLALKL